MTYEDRPDTGPTQPAALPGATVLDLTDRTTQFDREWGLFLTSSRLTVEALCHGLDVWVEIDDRTQAMERRLRRRYPQQWRSHRGQALDAELAAYHCPGPEAADSCSLCRDGLYRLDVLQEEEPRAAS